jgi:hypothetical protein
MLKDIVYSKNILEFVTVANEYCNFLEEATSFEKKDFIDRTLKILPLLYLKGSLLPDTQKANEEENEQFVTEYDWSFIRSGIQAILNDDDTYIDNYDLEMNELPEPVTYSLSEHLADIYQDLKNFIEIYKLGNEALSNDAIYDCSKNFKYYWGIKALHTLRIFHFLLYNKSDNSTNQSYHITHDPDDWFISKAQKEFQKKK